jgi:peptide/nickel transport system substrate-binding protein
MTTTLARRPARLIAALVVVLALVPAVYGSASPAGAGARNPNADPKGVARYGVNFVNFLFQDNFNPALSISIDAEYVFFDYLYDTLLDQNKTGTKIVPGLAESWEIVDPNTLELKLRDGLEFSNGDPLTSAEVKASVEYAKRSSPLDPRRMKTWVNLTEVQTPDAQTVRFVMSRPEAFGLQYQLTGLPGMIVHKSMIDGTGTEPIGAGPFQFESYQREQIVKMTKNPNYYNADKILLGGLDIVNVDLGPAGITALQSGAIDMTTTDAVTIQRLSGNAKFGTDSKPGNTYYNVYLRLDGPMANVKFRQALSTALDRTAMNDVVQAGLGETTVQPYQKASPYYNASVANAYKYSMKKAKKLLAESGVPAGTTLEIVYPGQAANVEQLRQAEIVKSQWEKLGLTINLIPAPDTPAIIAQYYTNKSSDGFSATIVGSANPVQQVQGRFFAGQFVATNQNSVLPQVEQLYLQFQQNPEDPKPIQDAVKYMVDNAVEIPIAFRNRNLAWDAQRLGGPVTAPTEVTDNIELNGVYVKKG